MLSAVGALAVTAALVWQDAYAGFTDTTTKLPATVSTGTVAVSNNVEGYTALTLPEMRPGDSATECIIVTSTGSEPSQVMLYGKDRATTGGDLSLQACADDPQVAYHAIRDLARMGRGVVNTRWTVMGFGRASAGQGQSTPRNLQGFKDGTRNIKEPAEIEQFVWTKDDVGWMTGGTYQVARKIRMDIEIWDADDVADQQRIFGRRKQDGSPLTGKDEFDTPDFTATTAGQPTIDPRSHVALAAHENNNGLRIFRRGYNFTDGINELGQLDAGLLFVAYMNDPAHFVTLQTKLGGSDLLNEYIAHIGSGIFAIPPAPEEGHYIGQALFA